MKLYRCRKTVLRFYPNAGRFIRDYSTNVPEAPRNAFVNLQGKTIAVVDQCKISEEELWVVLELSVAARFLSHLKKYLFLTGTTAQTDEKMKVYWDLENKIKPGPGNRLIPQKMGQLLVTETELETNVTEEEFTLFRVKNGIPLQGVDYDEELVLNLGDDTLVSFTKGCYLGQEIVARVHYRGKAPKKLVVKPEGECGPEELDRMTSKVFDSALGQRVGFVMEIV